MEETRNRNGRVSDGISKAAQAKLASFDGPIVPPDFLDPEMRSAFRSQRDEFGYADTANIDFSYTHQDDNIGGVPVLRIRGSQAPDPDRVLLHFHGGGFVIGSPRGNASLPVQVAEAASIEVISVDYRLAPEHPFPAALDDGLTAYRALLSDYDASRIGVFGESAGGALTVSLAMALRDAGEPLPGALVAIAPFADMTGSGNSVHDPSIDDPTLDWGSLSPGALLYAGASDPRDPLLSPVFGDYLGLPPVYVQIGSREILRDDSLRMAEACRKAGVSVDLDVWEGMWHCFHFDPTLPESQLACARIAGFFQEYL